MLYSVTNLSTFGIVETVERANKIACNSSYSLKRYSVLFASSAGRTYISDYSGISAYRVPVNRVIYRAVSYA